MGMLALVIATILFNVISGLPEFLVQPQPVLGTVGDTVFFHCRGDELTTLYNTEWFVQASGAQIQNTSSKYAVFENGTLKISWISLQDRGFYRCQLSDKTGVSNFSVFLNVEDPSLSSPPGLVHVTSLVEATFGENLTLECVLPLITNLIWLKNGDTVTTNDRLTVSVTALGLSQLHIADAEHLDEGLYECVNQGRQDHQSFRLVLLSLPVWIDLPSPHIIIPSSETVSIPCLATGWPVPTVSWTDPAGERVPVASEHSNNASEGVSMVSTNGTLTLTLVSPSHAGLYKCTWTNTRGVVEQQMLLTVGAPPSFEIIPESATVTQGVPLSLHCTAAGVPTPSISWSYRRSSEDQIMNLITDNPDNSLAFEKIAQDHAGLYTCTAYNVYGTLTASASLIVLDPPVFTLSPVAQFVTIDEPMTLNCVAQSTTKVNIYWMKDDVSVSEVSGIVMLSNSSLFIPGVQRTHYGEYTCFAFNLGGSVSASAGVLPKKTPEWSIRPENVSVWALSGFSLYCLAFTDGDAPIVYSWYFTEKESCLNSTLLQSSFSGAYITERSLVTMSGIYTCIAAGSGSQATSTAYVEVKALEKPTIWYSPASFSVNTSESFHLLCSFSSTHEANITWHNARGSLWPALHNGSYTFGETFAPSNSTTTSTVMVSQAIPSRDTGPWECESCNVAGCISATVWVRIEGLPIWRNRGFSTNQTSRISKAHCTAYGTPTPHVEFVQFDTVNFKRVPLLGEGVYVESVPSVDEKSDVSAVLTITEAEENTTFACNIRNKYGYITEIFGRPPYPVSINQLTVNEGTGIVTWEFPGILAEDKLFEVLGRLTTTPFEAGNYVYTEIVVPAGEFQMKLDGMLTGMSKLTVMPRNLFGEGPPASVEFIVPDIPRNLTYIPVEIESHDPAKNENNSFLITWLPPDFGKDETVKQLSYHLTLTLDSSDFVVAEWVINATNSDGDQLRLTPFTTPEQRTGLVPMLVDNQEYEVKLRACQLSNLLSTQMSAQVCGKSAVIRFQLDFLANDLTTVTLTNQTAVGSLSTTAGVPLSVIFALIGGLALLMIFLSAVVGMLVCQRSKIDQFKQISSIDSKNAIIDYNKIPRWTPKPSDNLERFSADGPQLSNSVPSSTTQSESSVSYNERRVSLSNDKPSYNERKVSLSNDKPSYNERKVSLTNDRSSYDERRASSTSESSAAQSHRPPVPASRAPIPGFSRTDESYKRPSIRTSNPLSHSSYSAGWHDNTAFTREDSIGSSTGFVEAFPDTALSASGYMLPQAHGLSAPEIVTVFNYHNGSNSDDHIYEDMPDGSRRKVVGTRHEPQPPSSESSSEAGEWSEEQFLSSSLADYIDESPSVPTQPQPSITSTDDEPPSRFYEAIDMGRLSPVHRQNRIVRERSKRRPVHFPPDIFVDNELYGAALNKKEVIELDKSPTLPRDSGILY